jgi:hypothetical protein
MVRRDRRRVRSMRLATVLVLAAGRGSAFGFHATVSLFGGPANQVGPTPTVTLPPGGSATPITATEPSGSAQFGPAVIFQSGPLTVSTQGTTGPGGSVTSSADITGDPNGPGPFLYEGVHSECTVSESGVSGSTTITGGVVETSYNPETQEPVTTEPVPVNPAPNLEITGTLDHVGDSFRIVFNEQIPSADGLTVNGAHLYLLGPTAVGDLIIAQSVCGVTATQTPTTLPDGATTTTQPGATTTSIQPGATTTTVRGVTTTTAPRATTTTVRRATTTSTISPVAPKTPPPPSEGKSALVRTGSAFQSLALFALLTLVLGALLRIGFSSHQPASAGAGAGSSPWTAVVRRAVARHRRRRPWNRRPWL